MAIYKIFPYKDATLYSSSPSSNTGLDAICEVEASSKNTSRFITQFLPSEIEDVIENKIQNNSWDVYFKNYIADSTGMSLEVKVKTFPLAQSWDNGTGEFGDIPTTTNGASWLNTDISSLTPWLESGSINNNYFTSSFQPNNPGGGCWFYSGSNIQSYEATQSFNLRSYKDLNLDVKPIVERWYSGSLPNNGFITKFEESVEFPISPSIIPNLKYFSVDTNTIYPPVLEFKWRDYTTVLSGSETNILDNNNIKISLSENPNIFYRDSITKFNINSSPLYPVRVFQTSSLFTTQYYLPTSSYYAVKDLDTNEFVINFDEEYTQISADEKGNFFNIYMDGLEPERYYKIQIKTINSGTTHIHDDNYYFKIIN
jgi:hypothetical protein